MQVPQKEKSAVLECSAGEVTFSDTSGYGVAGQMEYRDLPVFSSGGVSWKPKAGQRLLLVPCTGGMVCVGAQSNVQELKPGEIKLQCAKGYIHLKENGEVVINGVIISPEGVVTPASKM